MKVGRLVCSLCQGDFDLENEGGVTGELGILSISLCPWCYAGMTDLMEQMRLPVECPECGWFEKKDDDDGEQQVEG